MLVNLTARTGFILLLYDLWLFSRYRILEQTSM
jgi:hypothetical protein